MDTEGFFKPHTVCGCTESDTWSAGLLMSLQQEFTISIKFESSNIETLKVGLNNPVGIYLLSVSVGDSRVPGTSSSLE